MTSEVEVNVMHYATGKEMPLSKALTHYLSWCCSVKKLLNECFGPPPTRQMCGVAVLVFGVYMLVNFRMAALTPTLASFNSANMLLISGIIITCVSFLGFLGALKENRCLLLTVRHTRRPFAPQLYKRCLLHTVPCVVGFFFISKCWLYVLQIIRSNWDTVSENSWIFVMFFFNAVTPQIPLVSASGDRYLKSWTNNKNAQLYISESWI